VRRPAARSGVLAAEAAVGVLRHGVPLAGYARRIADLYGSGERSWLGRQTARLPDAVARAVVRAVVGLGVTRRHLVFGAIFGMRDGAPARGASAVPGGAA
jgi:hypothetical protein